MTEFNWIEKTEEKVNFREIIEPCWKGCGNQTSTWLLIKYRTTKTSGSCYTYVCECGDRDEDGVTFWTVPMIKKLYSLHCDGFNKKQITDMLNAEFGCALKVHIVPETRKGKGKIKDYKGAVNKKLEHLAGNKFEWTDGETDDVLRARLKTTSIQNQRTDYFGLQQQETQYGRNWTEEMLAKKLGRFTYTMGACRKCGANGVIGRVIHFTIKKDTKYGLLQAISCTGQYRQYYCLDNEIKHASTYLNKQINFQLWHPFELATVIDLIGEGVGLSTIAKSVGRSEIAIKLKIKQIFGVEIEDEKEERQGNLGEVERGNKEQA